MTIIPVAYENYFVNHPQERTLAQNLGEAFDVTYGDRADIYSYWFAHPQDHTCERFGLRDEVLVLYFDHGTIDGRILRAIRNIQADKRFEHRLEPILVLLVHRGDSQRIVDYLYSAEQDRVVVPIHANELFDPSRGQMFVRRRIAEFFVDKDLFGMTSPIKMDKYFFGRKSLVQELVARATVQAENSGVFGLRKTGKTSVLRAVERRALKRAVLIEYVECENPGIYRVRWWQVLQNIVERLRDNLSRRRRQRVEIQPKYSESNAGSRFVSDIQNLLAIGDLEHIILMLDEVEYITPKISGHPSQHWDEDFVPFWQTIRSAHQETRGSLVFIVAGVNPSSVQEPQFAGTSNPIFQLALPHFLSPFSRKAVRDMVRFIGRYSGLKFDEEVYEYLRQRFGGHPFLIRIACSEVWKTMSTNDPQGHVEVSVRDFEVRDDEIRARLAQHIKDILLSLVWWYPLEYELLQILAEGDEEFVDQYVQAYPDSVVQFQHYGILQESSRTEFAIEYLRDFLITHGEDYSKEISPFLRGDVPVDLLPAVPDLEVLGDLFKKRCDVEIRLRNVILFYLGFDANWKDEKVADVLIRSLPKRPNGEHPSSLFIGRPPQVAINQVYTLDLRAVILANWKVFGPLFDGDQTRFSMNLDTINTVRNLEAHTKLVTADEVADFNNSYGWLLRKLERVPGSYPTS